MSKVKVQYSLKNKEEIKGEEIGIYSNDTLLFKSNDTTFKVHLKEPFFLEEKQKEYELIMNFKEQNSTSADYRFYEFGNISVPIYTFYTKFQKNSFSLKYKLELEQEDEIFEFDVMYEVIE